MTHNDATTAGGRRWRLTMAERLASLWLRYRRGQFRPSALAPMISDAVKIGGGAAFDGTAFSAEFWASCLPGSPVAQLAAAEEEWERQAAAWAAGGSDWPAYQRSRRAVVEAEALAYSPPLSNSDAAARQA